MQRKCRGPEDYMLLCYFFLPSWSRPVSLHYTRNKTSQAAVHHHLLPSPTWLLTTCPASLKPTPGTQFLLIMTVTPFLSMVSFLDTWPSPNSLPLGRHPLTLGRGLLRNSVSPSSQLTLAALKHPREGLLREDLFFEQQLAPSQLAE